MSLLQENRKDGTWKINTEAKNDSCSPLVTLSLFHTDHRLQRSDLKENNLWMVPTGFTSCECSITRQSELNLWSNLYCITLEQTPWTEGRGLEPWADCPEQRNPSRPSIPATWARGRASVSWKDITLDVCVLSFRIRFSPLTGTFSAKTVQIKLNE